MMLVRISRVRQWSRLHPPNPFVIHARCKGTASEQKKDANKYRNTLLLPQTPFSIRAFADKRERLFRQRSTSDLYKWQASQEDRPLFVLHDGPPYANGAIHMGHAINKVLKDIINRYQVLQGKRIHYHPGWDCHGLPIEAKAVNDDALQKTHFKDIPPVTLRQVARKVAKQGIDQQMDSFKLLGIMADWSPQATYYTFDRKYELRQLAILREMVKRNLIYRANRPVYWSPSSRTALAEAEIEYNEAYRSRSVFVRFGLRPGQSLQSLAKGVESAEAALREDAAPSLLIWTTTPWTLPANMAVVVNPKMLYSLVRCTEGQQKGKTFIVATERIEALQGLETGTGEGPSGNHARLGKLERIMQFEGTSLLDSMYEHPFLPAGKGLRPILAASYVSSETGTGLVHSAPGHGQEDYLTWKDYCKENREAAKEEIASPVDEVGTYNSDLESLMEPFTSAKLLGLPVMTSGNDIIIGLLQEKGVLIAEHLITHKYPFDWRSRQPILVRSTSQWFANLEPVKSRAIASLQNVHFIPETGKSRLESLIRDRNEWCISRQRVWGVPIPVLYNAETGESLMSEENMRHIESVLAKHGIDYWWQGNAEEFVAPTQQTEGKKWIKGSDTVDVWFDSGSSWNILPGVENNPDQDVKAPSVPVADVYLEGSDQHRGWFQSSLLTYISTSEEAQSTSAPYKTVITHGFTVDGERKKMSKSLGNVISPMLFIEGDKLQSVPAYGTDVLRLWIARGDFTRDMIVSQTVIKQSHQILSTFRNACRFMLANVTTPILTNDIDEKNLGLLDRYVLSELYSLEVNCRYAYDTYDVAQVLRRASEFVTSTLSSLYSELSKDVLYASAKNDPQRQVTIAVMSKILQVLITVLAPIIPHLAEEVFHYAGGAQSDPIHSDATESFSSDAEKLSIFQTGWQSVPARFHDPDAVQEFDRLTSFRSSINALIELHRKEKGIKAMSELEVNIYVSGSSQSGLKQLLIKHREALSRIFAFAQVTIMEDVPNNEMRHHEDSLWTLKGAYEGVTYTVQPSQNHKCPRCWTFHSLEPNHLCARCESVLQDKTS